MSSALNIDIKQINSDFIENRDSSVLKIIHQITLIQDTLSSTLPLESSTNTLSSLANVFLNSPVGTNFPLA